MNINQQGSGPPPPAPRPMGDLLSDPKNFSRLLTGQSSLPQIQSEDLSDRTSAARDRQEAENADAHKKFTGGLIGASIGLAGMGLALAKETTAFEGHARGILAGQLELQKFNGQINQAFAKLKASDLLMRREMGERTAGTTALLADSIGDLNRETKDIQAAAATTANLFGIGLTILGRGVNEIIKTNTFARLGIKILADTEAKLRSSQQGPWVGLIADLADGKHSKKERDRHAPRKEK